MAEKVPFYQFAKILIMNEIHRGVSDLYTKFLYYFFCGCKWL